MKVFVTGGLGFLGSAVLRRLAIEGGFEVQSLVRPGKRLLSGRQSEGASRRFASKIVEASLHDRRRLSRILENTEVVIHIAASKQGSAPAQVFNTVVGTQRLLEACVDAGVGRVILVSSFGVMDAAGTPRGGLIDEATPLDPHPERRDPYTFAKHQQERLARRFAQEHGLPLVVVRPAVIFGPPQDMLSSRIGQDVFGLFLHLGNGMQVPLTDVDNCAAALVRATRAKGIEGKTYCIVDDDLPTSRAILRRYKREVRWFPSVSIPWRIMRQLARINAWYSRRTHNHLPPVFTTYEVDSKWKGHRYANKRAKKELGWHPELPMSKALDRAFEFLSQAAGGA